MVYTETETGLTGLTFYDLTHNTALVAVGSGDRCSMFEPLFTWFSTDWYPTYLVVEQDGHDINVTFNLAPPDLQLGRYLSSCYGGGERTYTALEPVSRFCLKAERCVVYVPNVLFQDLKNNNTQYTYRLSHLYPGVNYKIGRAHV